VGIGTIAWGEEKSGFGKTFREPELKEVFKAAMDGGINFFDTAEVYGYGSSKFEQSSEHLCGRFAEEYMDASHPPVIGSKVRRNSGNSGANRECHNRWNISRANTL